MIECGRFVCQYAMSFTCIMANVLQTNTQRLPNPHYLLCKVSIYFFICKLYVAKYLFFLFFCIIYLPCLFSIDGYTCKTQ